MTNLFEMDTENDDEKADEKKPFLFSKLQLIFFSFFLSRSIIINDFIDDDEKMKLIVPYWCVCVCCMYHRRRHRV